MNGADTTIILAQHGRGDLTRGCVASIRETDPIGWPIEVIDDGGGWRDCRSVEDERHRSVVVYRQPWLGLTAAWNRAIARVRTPKFILLNNDVVARGPWVSQLVQPLRDNAAVLGGAAWRTERHADCRRLPRLGGDRYLAGWCLAMSRRHWDRLGPLDERFFLYFSDTDLQVRVRQLFGAHSICAVEQLPLRHSGGASTAVVGRKREFWLADRRTFFRKWS